MISLFDVRLATPVSSSQRDSQAVSYRQALGFCLQQPNCEAFVTWGYTDKYSWIPSFFPGYDQALPFDSNYGKKPAYNAMLDVLNNQVVSEAGSPAAKSSDTHDVRSIDGASEGQIAVLRASGSGDYATYQVTGIEERTYKITARVRKGNDRGKVQLSVASSLDGSYSNYGSEQDLYASSKSYERLDLGSITSPGDGWNTSYFKFTVTGKNGSSNGHEVWIDTITLAPE